MLKSNGRVIALKCQDQMIDSAKNMILLLNRAESLIIFHHVNSKRMIKEGDNLHKFLLAYIEAYEALGGCECKNSYNMNYMLQKYEYFEKKYPNYFNHIMEDIQHLHALKKKLTFMQILKRSS